MRGAWESGGVAKGHTNSSTGSSGHDKNKSVSWKKTGKDNYAFELGKMMCEFLEEKKAEATKSDDDDNHVAETHSENDDPDDDDDVVMGEHYNLDQIDEFLAAGSKANPVDVTEDPGKKLSPEAKKIGKWVGLKSWPEK